MTREQKEEEALTQLAVKEEALLDAARALPLAGGELDGATEKERKARRLRAEREVCRRAVAYTDALRALRAAGDDAAIKDAGRWYPEEGR